MIPHITPSPETGRATGGTGHSTAQPAALPRCGRLLRWSALLLLLSGCGGIGASPPTEPTPPAVDKKGGSASAAQAAQVEKSPEDRQREAVADMHKKLGLMEKEMSSLRGEVEVLRNANQRLNEQLAQSQPASPGAGSAAAYGAPAAPGGYPTTYPPSGASAYPSTSAPAPYPAAGAPAPYPTAATPYPAAGTAPAATSPYPQSVPTAAPTPAEKPVAVASLPPTKTPPPAPPKAVDEPAATPKEAYDAAFLLLKSSQYEQALEAFSHFVKTYPSDPLAGNAHWWLGDILYVQKRYADSLQALNQVITKWPASPKVPNALFKMGLCFDELGDKDNARLSLERLVKDYPKFSNVDLAKDKLKKLDAAGKKR
ncbi:MAG: tol-pal system protein YbgF [Magnetococcales bacterium]|nr:tol-pal system protein YbgF [Magnetococcales bacterium]